MVGILRLVIEVPESRSLKDTRSVVKSLRERMQARFKIAIAEVGFLDSVSRSELGVACISTDRRHADEMLNKLADWAEVNCSDGHVSHVKTEIISLG